MMSDDEELTVIGDILPRLKFVGFPAHTLVKA